MLLPFQGDHHMHEITQGAAALYPGLCAFSLTARLNEGLLPGKALRERMQSFAWAVAKLCVDGCKALRERMQSFAPEVG